MHRAGRPCGKVWIDPGHGVPTSASCTNLIEHSSLQILLPEAGSVRLSHGVLTWSYGDSPPMIAVHARILPRVDADLLSLHIDAHSTPSTGRRRLLLWQTSSSVHSAFVRFADLYNTRSSSAPGSVDANRRKTGNPPRTRMLRALDLGYLTHPRDAARLADPAFRDTVAEAVLVSLQRLYQPTDLRANVVKLPAPAI